MKRTFLLSIAVFVFTASPVWSDTFGTGDNQFTIDFVPISGDAGNLGNWSAGSGYTFSGVNHGDYRMGTYEITNAQFAKFAFNTSVRWTLAEVPSNSISWYEAAQFVNWLNTSKGYQAAYKFTDSTFSVWAPGDAGYIESNPYRNSNAFYFLPTEDEWVKAAYWNGSTLQTYSNASAGDLIDGLPNPAKWNYCFSHWNAPWDATSGVKELNGTYNMMGNVREWMESPYHTEDYLSGSYHSFRGGSYSNDEYDYEIASSYRYRDIPDAADYTLGFRVASIPEPCTLLLLGLGGLALRRKKHR